MGLLIGTAGKAKAEDAVAGVGGEVVVAERHASARRTVAPTAATDHAVRARRWTRRIVRRRYRIICTTVPIAAPFPNIAAHIARWGVAAYAGENL